MLWEQLGRSQGEPESYRSLSVIRPYRWKTANGAEQEMPLRFLVVESTQRAKTQAPWPQQPVWRVTWQEQERPAMLE